MEYWQLLRKHLGNQQLILNSAVGAIVDRGEILLVKPRDNMHWHVPGGVQDLDESITATVEREIREELGLSLQVDELISVFSDPKWTFALSNGHILQPFTMFFLMRGEFERKDIVIDETEIESYAFFPLDAIPENTEACCKVKCDDLRLFEGLVRFH